MNESEITNDERLWQQFAYQEQLIDDQLDAFKQYAALLLAWNKKSNLTAITSMRRIITDHFQDSLALKHAVDLSMMQSLADVGSGGGFPGISLAIRYPHITVTLIEVNQKKIQFLQEVITVLGIANVLICDYDWRTFLRQTSYTIQLFCARASLQPEELIHMFKPSCSYCNAQLVYWASVGWVPTKKVLPFIKDDVAYRVDNKQRRLILLRSKYHEKGNTLEL